MCNRNNLALTRVRTMMQTSPTKLSRSNLISGFPNIANLVELTPNSRFQRSPKSFTEVATKFQSGRKPESVAISILSTYKRLGKYAIQHYSNLRLTLKHAIT